MKIHYKKFIFVCIPILLVAQLFFDLPMAQAVPVYDYANGTYADDFDGTTGLPTRYHAAVNTTPDYVQLLRNTGSGFVAPFYNDGYVYTSVILPTNIAAWRTISFSAVTPLNTTLKVQVGDVDKILYGDDILPGNSAGFSTSPIDISAVPPMTLAGTGGANGKVGRLTLKILLTTTDTNSTPTFDDLVVSWTTKQGDLTATTAETHDWPMSWGNQQGTTHLNASNPEKYSAFRWASEKYDGYSTANNSYVYNGKLITNEWFGGHITDHLRSFDTDTGSVEWQVPYSGRAYFSIGQNGTAYQAEDTNDVMNATDLETGSLKWLYDWSGGHGTDTVIISKDGLIYTVRQQSLICNANACVTKTSTIYAYNPDGTINWTKNITVVDDYIYSGGMSYDPTRDTLYYGSSTTDADGVSKNGGMLYAIDVNTQEVKWEYLTHDQNWLNPPAVGADGTVYVANSNYGVFEKGVYAINPNGTLKWYVHNGEDSDTGYYNPISLRDDGVLMVVRIGQYEEDWRNYSSKVQAFSMNDGSMLWEKVLSGAAMSHTDSDDYAYLSSIDFGADPARWSASVGYYDQNFNNKWKIFFPYDNSEGGDWTRYAFESGQNMGSSLVPDSRGWLYGSLGKMVLDNPVDWNIQRDKQFSQYFALAPWTLSVAGLSGNIDPGSTVAITATTAMQQTNPLFGGANQVQAVMENGDKVALSYSSTDVNGDTVWTGTYTIPTDIAAGEHTFTIEASQSYMQTDISTHFATATTESGNTGIVKTGTFQILGASILPETGSDFSIVVQDYLKSIFGFI